ncbi:cysteine hydrolase family protein [Haladaptatus salinisoli]|uniref:cysteine hydrolase family protein n=1 Tax=Haladaptatus salinisoli TaxID=2884876 RepID=UPI001D0B1540|nr:cysteine hydrolase family protein [Haladaptatus salinisoli]
MIEIPSNTALLTIDVQQGFENSIWGDRNNPNAETRIQQLLEIWRELEQPIIHVQHMSQEAESPLRPNQPGNAFKPETAPQTDEPVFQKDVNSAFIGTNLETYLREREIESLVITGLTTNHCVSTTTRVAENLGFDSIVVSDATAAFDQQGADGQEYSAEIIHEVALANLRDEFAVIATTHDIQSYVSY